MEAQAHRCGPARERFQSLRRRPLLFHARCSEEVRRILYLCPKKAAYVRTTSGSAALQHRRGRRRPLVGRYAELSVGYE
jgi:hypothetical protein